MCLVLDTNRFGDALANPVPEAYAPLLRWLTEPNGDGSLVLGGTKYREEIARHGNARRFFVGQLRAGRAVLVEDGPVDQEEKRLRDGAACASDDEHVIALARISGARVVCTEDQALWTDIKNKALLDSPRGRIYRTADHAPLLHHDAGCQRSPKKTAPSRKDRGRAR